MTVELRPLGVKCNIQCQYCYQNPQRDAGNVLHKYDLDVMMKAVEAEGGPFALFGGEPLLLPIADLERLWEWGLSRFGKNSIQTNGVLINDEHVRLFRRYQVQVGLSLDGPAELNDARWAGSLDRTRETTARVEAVIEQLCREGTPPTLIVTLHRGNATADKLPSMHSWLRSLQAMGVRSARLHLLEVDHADVRRTYALSPDENREAIRSFAELESELTTLRLDLFEDVRRMLLGDDDGVTCVWGACDPYTTSAVRGIEGNGQRSNCGRTNKDGIDFTKAADEGFERYLALYHTPQEEGGCKGCRFFLFCKGQCPGTALDNDWRNRSEHCPVWMESYERVERELVESGREPLSLSPLREPLERFFLSAWEAGHNTTLAHALGVLRQAPAEAVSPTKTAVYDAAGTPGRLGFHLPSFTRVAWASDAARDVWASRLERLRKIGPELEWRVVAAGVRPCAVIPLPEGPAGEESAPWLEHGLSSERLDGGRVVVGRADDLTAFRTALASGDDAAISRLLGHPDCCRTFFRRVWVDDRSHDPTWATAVGSAAPQRDGDTGDVVTIDGPPQANVLWRWLGVRPVPHTPCRFDCPATIALADRIAAVGRASGLGREVEWLYEILSWPAEWSALHGIAEVRTPVLKVSTRTDATARRRSVRWVGHGGCYPSEGARGVRFPYVTPRKPLLTVTPGYQRGLENTAASPPRPRVDSDGVDTTAIHREALAALEAGGRVAGRSVRGIHLTPYFTVVELDDGSVGAGMSYFGSAGTFRERLPAPSAADPLLLHWLFDDPDPIAPFETSADRAWHLVRSLRTAILSALTTLSIRAGGDGTFQASAAAPIDPFAEARRAVVIGFGGYMDRLAAAPQIEHLHVCDLGYAERKAEMESVADGYRARHPSQRITLSDGGDARARIEASDVVAITGSALCNGTMGRLLKFARGGPAVVVQGQSAAIHPLPLFRRGVRMVATTEKPPELARQAAADPSGLALRPYLEGGLPWVYLAPSPAAAGNGAHPAPSAP